MKSGPPGDGVQAAATGLYRTWQKADPRAAMDWALRQPPGTFGEFQDRMLQLMRDQGTGVLTKIGLTADSDAWLDRNAVTTALRKNNTMEAALLLGGDGGLTYADHLLEQHQGMDAEAMETLLDGLAQNAFRSGIAARFAGRMVTTDPVAAIEFASVAATDLPSEEFSKFAKNFSAIAPLATSQWLETMAPGDRRDAVIRELNPVILADGDPAAAFQWAVTVTDGAQRLRLATPALAAWALADPVAAAAALQSPNLSDAERAALQPLLPPAP